MNARSLMSCKNYQATSLQTPKNQTSWQWMSVRSKVRVCSYASIVSQGFSSSMILLLSLLFNGYYWCLQWKTNVTSRFSLTHCTRTHTCTHALIYLYLYKTKPYMHDPHCLHIASFYWFNSPLVFFLSHFFLWKKRMVGIESNIGLWLRVFD